MDCHVIRAALALLILATGPFSVRAQTSFVVRDVRVFDGERVAEHKRVLIEDGKIARVGGSDLTVPLGTEIIDGRGRTLMPGMIDAHVHLTDSAESDLRQAMELGVTTVIDMFSASTRFERIKAIRAADAFGVADVRTAGTGATVPGGHPTQMGGPPTQMGGPPFPTISDSSEAAAFVDARFAEGSDFLKIIYDDLVSIGMRVPMMDRRTLAGLIAAAHRRGKLAVVHVLTEAEARDAIEAGADGLAHLATGATVSPDFADFVASHRVFVIPTLSPSYAVCGKPIGPSIAADTLLSPFIRPKWLPHMANPTKFSGGPFSCAGTDEAVRQLARRKVPILVGTDAPGVGQTYGASVHGELQLLVGAGLTPIQALTGATAAAARAFRLTDRGRIQEGLRADLVLVDGDPTTNILDTRRIAMVWKRGAAVQRATSGQQ
jgi:imidazolonepropionase-like amidohydrolase